MFFPPSSTANSPTRVPCSVTVGDVRKMNPWWGSLVMLSAPEAVHSTVLLSQHRGAIAEVTADAYEPPMATTLSTSISLRAARTAASGLLWSSSMTTSTLRPRTPPAALISATAICAAWLIVAPNWLVAPVNGMMMPMRIGPSPCAIAQPGRAEMPKAAPAPRNARRSS